MWNKGDVAGAPSPSRRGLLRRSRGVSGVLCPWIFGSGGLRCSLRGCCGGGGGCAAELLFPVSVSVSVRFALALPWSFWGWCSSDPVVVCCLYSAWICRRGSSSSGAWSAVEGGSCSCSPSTLLTKDGGAQFQQVRGVSPAVVVHRFLSRRICACRWRRVSLLVQQWMLGWSLGVRFVVFVAPLLLFLRSSPDRSVVGACVLAVMFLFYL